MCEGLNAEIKFGYLCVTGDVAAARMGLSSVYKLGQFP